MIMVFKSCGQNIELETADYYNKELAFQKQIDAKNLGNTFADSFNILDNGSHIIINNKCNIESDSITLDFYKPDKASADRHFIFKGNSIPQLDKKNFISGIYKLSIRLFKGENVYLIEKKLKF
jgi:archaellum component FlaF (FlaF/FlaG flagellin family)